MALLDIFKRKERRLGEVRLPEPRPSFASTEQYQRLPEELESFRVQREPVQELPSPQPTSSYDLPMPSTEVQQPHTSDTNKMDLILQKLETIDIRLKLLEERIKRY